MKTNPSNTILAVFATLMLAVAIALPTGCKTTDGTTNIKAVAYHTLKDTQISVKTAMNIYADKCVAGKVTVEKQAKIDKAHADYRVAWRLAVTLAKNDYSTLTPESVLLLSTDLLNLISQL